ncbi:peptidase m23b [Colletotrichum truncatum]|uniref:Peptidase m23b n=1 Tax=Colletotrichum truncatum TaxID=5467 RepID=A0ACC3YY51_COLTU|nr:peptidase m23b [Colletotrichum truncatum]KAF6786481.1 peptidase m23b [Colletotrichum truncatum]
MKTSMIIYAVAAIAGVAQAKRGCAPDPNNKGSGWYRVETGDTLNDIAKDFGSTAEKLAEDSNIANKDVIFPGQIVTVPCKA